MNTETKHTQTPLKTVIHAANMLGALAENQLLPEQIRDIGRKAWEEADTEGLIREHAALCAVAEAAKNALQKLSASESEREHYIAALSIVDKLTSAIANLEAIRNQS